MTVIIHVRLKIYYITAAHVTIYLYKKKILTNPSKERAMESNRLEVVSHTTYKTKGLPYGTSNVDSAPLEYIHGFYAVMLMALFSR